MQIDLEMWVSGSRGQWFQGLAGIPRVSSPPTGLSRTDSTVVSVLKRWAGDNQIRHHFDTIINHNIH